jgi:hypothetical protein
MKNLIRHRLARVLLVALTALSPLLAASQGTQKDALADNPGVSVESAARGALAAYLALWDGARPADTSSFSEAVVLRYAHANPELKLEVQGRTSVATQVRTMARLGSSWQFRDLRVFPTLHENIYYAQFTASGQGVAGGAGIDQVVVVALEMDGLRLARLVEFSNPAVRLAESSH